RCLGSTAEKVRTSDRHEREDQHAIADVPEEIAEPEARREQSPEQRVAPSLWIGAVARAADRERREHRSCKHIEPVEVDHNSSPSLSGGGGSAEGWWSGWAPTPPPRCARSPSPSKHKEE